MRFANLAGRSTLLLGDRAVDLHEHSHGRLPVDPAEALEAWDAVLSWAGDVPPSLGVPFDQRQLGAPSPRPRQVFAIGLNYRSHAVESGFELPADPLVFTKFPSCIVGPNEPVSVPEGRIDWEVELVVVIGQGGRHVATGKAWRHVAGLTLGQDFSERTGQLSGTPPQFSLGKSHPGFGPIGPVLVTPDELGDPDDIEIGCSVNGIEVQRARTSDLVFPVSQLVGHLSSICELYPGDLIFTGTPAGVGLGRTPAWYLSQGDVVESFAEGIGELRSVLGLEAPRKAGV